MKKIIVTPLIAAILFSGTLFASAQTSTTSSLQSLIESLKSQIADLQAKVQAQKKATSDVREAAGSVRETLGLIRELRQGMSGLDVKVLQGILAADAEIYPEGKITGFFGSLTAKAVKRFQKKRGIGQVGNVGPKTLEKLQKELDKNPLAEEDDDRSSESSGGEEHENHDKHFCAIVPPGHLIAPGWLRKNAKPVVPTCQVIPPGIARKLGLSTSTATSTPDVTPPAISSVSATGITASSTTILWNTNELSDSAVWYSTSTPVQATGTTPMVSSASLVISHSLSLTGLAASTAYHFIVTSADASGNKAVSAELSFTTLAPPDTTAPVISSISATGIASSSANIIWTTNELATSKVWYATSSPVQATGTTPMVSSGALVLSHNIAVSGLNATTTYFFLVESSDGSGNRALGTESSFTTAAP